MKKLLLILAIFASQTLVAQNVGIGTTAPLAKLHISNGASGNTTPFSPLVVESNANTFINLLSPNTNETGLLFGKADNAASGAIVYNNVNTLNGFQFRTAGNITQMILNNTGNLGIGLSTPNAKLSISANGTELVGTAAGNTLRTNAGNLGSTAGSEISLANIGFLSSNNSSLGIRAYRSFAGTDWISTALLIGYDVDNTVRAGGGFLALSANGNIGISTTTPQAKLDVNGSIKVNSLTIATGGAVSDFLIKNDAAGLVSFRKGYVGLGLNYIIRTQGAFPTQGSGNNDIAFVGEIKLFAGNFAPNNWAFCDGQLLSVNAPYDLLFALIGTTYGGNGTTNFALPDLRNAVPVGAGSNWLLGERSN